MQVWESEAALLQLWAHPRYPIGREKGRDLGNICLPGFQSWRGLRNHLNLPKVMPSSGWTRHVLVQHCHRRRLEVRAGALSQRQVRFFVGQCTVGQHVGFPGGSDTACSAPCLGPARVAQLGSNPPGTMAIFNAAGPADGSASINGAGNASSNPQHWGICRNSLYRCVTHIWPALYVVPLRTTAHIGASPHAPRNRPFNGAV